MSEKEKDKLKNGEEILNQIKAIKAKYEAAEVDQREEELNFLDKLNRLVQLILNDDTFSVYTALESQSLEHWHKKKFSRAVKRLVVSNYTNTLYFLLLATITGFLVSEALSFYSLDSVIDTKTYVKAILTEVCFIFLSGYRAATWMGSVWVGILRLGIFALMLFVITSQSIDVGTKTISENQIIAEQIVIVQEQIKEKQKQIDYYKKINWPRNATQSRLQKEKLVEKLIGLKEQQAAGKNEDVSQVEKYKMYGRAAFRVILLFISVLITRRIFSF